MKLETEKWQVDGDKETAKCKSFSTLRNRPLSPCREGVERHIELGGY